MGNGLARPVSGAGLAFRGEVGDAGDEGPLGSSFEPPCPCDSKVARGVDLIVGWTGSRAEDVTLFLAMEGEGMKSLAVAVAATIRGEILTGGAQCG